MQALVAERSGQLHVAEVPAPEPEPGQAIVRLSASAVSPGTELRMLYRDDGTTPGHPGWPAVGAFGYLGAGEVVQLGEGTEGIAVGDRVSCGRAWGIHRELIETPASSLIRLPDDVDDVAGAAAYWAVPPLCGILAAGPRFNDDVAVIGLGPLGLCAVQMLTPWSRRVIAIDHVGSRCELARRYGALAIDASETDPETALGELLPERPSVVLQVAGTPSALELALAIVRPKGDVVNVGSLPKLEGVDLFWPMQISGARLLPIHRPGTGSPQGGGPSSPRHAYLPEVFELIQRGRLDVAGLCRWVLPIEAAPRVFPALRDHPELGPGIAFRWDGADTERDDGVAFEEALSALEHAAPASGN